MAHCRKSGRPQTSAHTPHTPHGLYTARLSCKFFPLCKIRHGRILSVVATVPFLEVVVARMGRPELPREAQVAFWDGIRAGLGVEEAAVAAGGNRGQGGRGLRAAGGGEEAAPRAPSSGRGPAGGG